jgi:hypothetical protein
MLIKKCFSILDFGYILDSYINTIATAHLPTAYRHLVDPKFMHYVI